MILPQVGLYIAVSQLGGFLASVVGYYSLDFNRPKNSFYIPVFL